MKLFEMSNHGVIENLRTRDDAAKPAAANSNLIPKAGPKALLGVLLCLTNLAVSAAPGADEEKLAAANTGFAFDLLKQIAAQKLDASVFISPFSVSTALQLAGNGAAGETRVEMQRVLKTGGLPAESLNTACQGLNQSLHSQTNAILDLANAIWYQAGIRLKPGFVADNQSYFAAKLARVDFTKPQSAQTINEWADKSTRGKIKEVVRWPFAPRTRVILANAIYFKGRWEHPFDKNQTKPHEFYLSGGGEKRVPMMWRRGHFSYLESDGFQAVRLPYAGGRLQMYLFLPYTNSSPAKLLAGLDGETWRDKVTPRFMDREGTLALPRFKMEYEVKLNHPLEGLGMHRAFSAEEADFSAMADETLFVSEVKQKSFVAVDEEGTEAAAVTTVRVATLAIMEPVKPFEMIVDRPFLFVISDSQTRSVLFMGMVYDPAAPGAG